MNTEKPTWKTWLSAEKGSVAAKTAIDKHIKALVVADKSRNYIQHLERARIAAMATKPAAPSRPAPTPLRPVAVTPVATTAAPSREVWIASDRGSRTAKVEIDAYVKRRVAADGKSYVDHLRIARAAAMSMSAEDAPAAAPEGAGACTSTDCQCAEFVGDGDTCERDGCAHAKSSHSGGSAARIGNRRSVTATDLRAAVDYLVARVRAVGMHAPTLEDIAAVSVIHDERVARWTGYGCAPERFITAIRRGDVAAMQAEVPAILAGPQTRAERRESYAA